jgi:ascorbate-specific PTS system EIIC-type component UlaA
MTPNLLYYSKHFQKSFSSAKLKLPKELYLLIDHISYHLMASVAILYLILVLTSIEPIKKEFPIHGNSFEVTSYS